MNTTLTPRQREVLDFMTDQYVETGLPPTFMETLERFGFRSPNGVKCHFMALLKKGFLRVAKDKGGSHRYLPAGYVVVSVDELVRLKANAKESREL